jgi:hypothetical protein
MSRKQLARHTSKIHQVPLGLIEVPPAYITQRPFIPSLGHRIANELDLDKLGFPIMNHRGGKFLCLDGQHRIFALREFGFEKTDLVTCEVYENLTDEEMAEIFLGRDSRRAIAPFYKFCIACTAGHVRESAIRRVVEAHGLKIERSRKENSIAAVSALCRVYDMSTAKDVAVGWIVRVAKNSFGGDPSGFDAYLLEALGLVYNRYNGRCNEKDLIARLSALPHGVRGLVQRGEAIRERTGSQKSQCLAAVVVETYNKGVLVKGNRLAPWWKESAAEVA